MKSCRGVEYDLVDALRRNPTIIMAGDDICGKAADAIEALQLALAQVLATHLACGDEGHAAALNAGSIIKHTKKERGHDDC